MKKITLKNYIILLSIIFITLCIVFYALNWYKQYNDTKLNTAVISSTLTEVKYEDIDDVVRERDFLIVYTCTASEIKCRNFETKFSKYINSNNLNEEIVYFSLPFEEKEEMLNKIYNNYKHEDLRKKVNNYPTLLVFSNGKIIDLLSPSDDANLSVSNVDAFLKGYEL